MNFINGQMGWFLIHKFHISQEFSTTPSRYPAAVAEQQHSQRQAVQKARLELATALAASLGVDQREAFRLYQPQIVSHTAELCHLIEEFFTCVEEQRHKHFYQKIQMVCTD